MEAFLNKILDKLSRYEIITNLIPGALLFCLLGKIGFQIGMGNAMLDIIVCYFLGLINNRFSSLCVEEPLKYIGFIKWREYIKYNNAKKARPFISVLQETANQFRALTAVFFLSLFAILYHWSQIKCPFMAKYGSIIIVFLLFLLFLFSYRKQVNDYVVKTIDEVDDELHKANDK